MQLSPAPDQIADAFLDSISNELRTPLVSIQGALSYLQQDEQRDPTMPDDHVTRRRLIDNAAEEAVRLNHLIGNLLDMARIESGALHVDPAPCDIADVIGAALEKLGTELYNRRVNVQTPATPTFVRLDFVLMVRVLAQLLDNAIKYSAPETLIGVCVNILDAQLEISIADHGIGIPPNDLARVFDKFYRVPRLDGVIGAGLGLTICERIVRAHGGNIRASNRGGGGTLITLTLPL